MKQLSLKQMSNEDLQWLLDLALEKSNKRKEAAVLKEMKKREMNHSV